MSGLPTIELEHITEDYFAINNKQAVDIYFNTSYLLNMLMKQQKGLWERPSGGDKIRIPLEYDGQIAEFYEKGDTVSSDDRESMTSAYFDWKHSYSNATIYRIDELKNSGEYAEVQLVSQRVGAAQKSLTKLLANSIYDSANDSSNRLTGLLALCNETTSLAYGGITEASLVSNDGTTPWEGKLNSTTEAISLAVLRTLASDAKIRDGADGKPNIITTTETLWNVVADLLQIQQRFTDSKTTASAGFTGLTFEGKEVFPDDYCPSGHAFALNSKHVGFAIHKSGYFMRSPWKVIPDSPEDRTMKIYWDGNMICNNRKAHKGHSNLS